jgi:CheY-like chemotaxis protein
MGNKKILLVDDEPDLLKVIGFTIDSWGYEVISVSNGKDAIEMVKTQKFDIVILDYLMPEMDGISTLKEIRKIDAEIPVIMLTAHSEGVLIKDIKDLKVNAFIPKMSADYMLKTAIEMIEKRNSHDW